MCADSDEWARTNGTEPPRVVVVDFRHADHGIRSRPPDLGPRQLGVRRLEPPARVDDQAQLLEPSRSAPLHRIRRRRARGAIMSSVCGRSAHSQSTSRDVASVGADERVPDRDHGCGRAPERRVRRRRTSPAAARRRAACSSPHTRVPRRARHRHHGDAAIGCRLRRDEARRRFTRLDDDEHLAERGDDAIAEREVEIARAVIRVATPTAATRVSADPLPDVGVLLGIRDVEAVADDADRMAAAGPDPAVSGTVDAARQARHDRQPGCGERLAKLECRRPSGSRRVASADDRDTDRAPARRGRPRRTSRPAETDRRRARHGYSGSSRVEDGDADARRSAATTRSGSTACACVRRAANIGASSLGSTSGENGQAVANRRPSASAALWWSSMICRRRGVIAGNAAERDQRRPLLGAHAACPTALRPDPRPHAERGDHLALVDLTRVTVEVGQCARRRARRDAAHAP